MRVLVYSGDVDSCVPYLGTEACMDALNLPVVEPWRAWIVDEQVAGYVKVLGGRTGGPSLTYATVKEAGHMVPTYKVLSPSCKRISWEPLASPVPRCVQPDEALALFQSFINGNQL
jgi:carboxypeptidase C (cathepsin A)